MTENAAAAIAAHDTLIRDNQRAMDRIFEELGHINTSLGQVRERMSALEASSLQPQMTEVRTELGALRERVAVLEGQGTARREVTKATDKQIEWIYRIGPWLFLVAYVVYTALRHGAV